jgi:transposase-like protein
MVGVNREIAEEYTEGLTGVFAGGWRLTLTAQKLGVPKALGLTTEEWQERIGGYVRLSVPERREAVAELAEEGLSIRETAAVLGTSATTVHNDQQAVQNGTPDSQNPTISGLEPEQVVQNGTPDGETVTDAEVVEDAIPLHTRQVAAGIMLVLAEEYDEVDVEHLIKRLAGLGSSGRLIGKAREYRDVNAGTMRRASKAVIVREYNKGRTKHTIGPVA